jgi:hypothetical protein
MLILMPMIVVGRGELNVNGAKESEDDGLQKANQQFHEVKREREEHPTNEVPGGTHFIQEPT